MLPDGRLLSPSAERNKGPILEILERVLPRSGLVLEVASGTGQHFVHFAKALLDLTWQPSDPDADCRRSISSWLAFAQLANVRQPLDIDVCRFPWPVSTADAAICINMIHISPWAATEALFSGLSTTLTEGGRLYLYGPYRRHGRHMAPSNVAFDAQLRLRNPAWGLRNIEDLARLADRAGFDLSETVEMPSNNLSVIFEKRKSANA